MTGVFLSLMVVCVVLLLVGLLTRRVRVDRCCGVPAERDLRMRAAYDDPP